MPTVHGYINKTQADAAMVQASKREQLARKLQSTEPSEVGKSELGIAADMAHNKMQLAANAGALARRQSNQKKKDLVCPNCGKPIPSTPDGDDDDD